MKIETPQILWHSDEHGKAAALTGLDLMESGVQIQDGGATQRKLHVLATAASQSRDAAVHLWRVELNAANPAGATNSAAGAQTLPTRIDFLTALNRHGDDEPASCCKFSPNGLHLAVAGEATGCLCIYSVPPSKRANGNGRHYWSTLRQQQQPPTSGTNCLDVKIAAHCGHGVTDLSWSADSKRLMLGTVDHAVWILEDANYTGAGGAAAATESSSEWRQVYRSPNHHAHYVQGVALDPLSTYFASQSSDRSVRILQRSLPNGRSATATTVKEQPSSQTILRTVAANAMDGGGCSVAVPPSATATARFLTQAPLEFAGNSSSNNKGSKQIKTYRVAVAGASAATETEEVDAKEKEGQEKTATTPTASVSATSRNHYYFCDESTLNSFVRRLAWTVDGAYLICPAALWTTSGNSNSSNNNNQYATLLFQRHHFDAPCRVLAGLEKPSVAVRPNPVLFALPEGYNESSNNDIDDDTSHAKENQSCTQHSQQSQSHPLPYRSLFAVLTWDSVLIYDTVQDQPLAIAKGLHYAHSVDAAWSPCGHTLTVCSTDGYVSILQFQPGELGQVYQEQPASAVTTASGATRAVNSSASPTTTSNAQQQPACNSSHKTPTTLMPPIPPCEPGPASVVGPPTKRAKTTPPSQQDNDDETTEATANPHKREQDCLLNGATVDKLSLDANNGSVDVDATANDISDSSSNKPAKKKKRIQPTLLSTTATS